MTDPLGERLREHPEQRFAPDEAVFDLAEAAAKLANEPGEDGHKQITLFKRGPETLALFQFQAGARLPDHQVDGPVFIHVLEGALRVGTAEKTHDLGAGMLLRLAPRVAHHVQARRDSRMLLTVCLEGPDSGQA